jgi:hypothetical protein
MAPPPPLSQQRKRRRKQEANDGQQTTEQRLRQYGVDLPQIPGLPLTIIPLHVFALKTTTRCFKKDLHYLTTAIPPYHAPDEEEKEESYVNSSTDPAFARANADGGGGNVMDRILDRVQKAAATADAASTATANGNHSDRQGREKQRDAIATWLNAIHRQVKDDHQYKKRKQEQEQQETQQQQQKPQESHSRHHHSVAIAALEHLWGIGLDHDRIDVRRATTTKWPAAASFQMVECTNGNKSTQIIISNSSNSSRWATTTALVATRGIFIVAALGLARL